MQIDRVSHLGGWTGDEEAILTIVDDPDGMYQEISEIAVPEGLAVPLLTISKGDVIENDMIVGFQGIREISWGPQSTWMYAAITVFPKDSPNDPEYHSGRDIPVLLNVTTGQMTSFADSLNDRFLLSHVWSPDGKRLYIQSYAGNRDAVIHEFAILADSVIETREGQVSPDYVASDLQSSIIMQDSLGVSDLLITRRMPMDENNPLRTLTVGRIVDGTYVEATLLQMDYVALNTSGTGPVAFLLTAPDEELNALSCIIGVGPSARLVEGARGRVTLTDGAGTRLRPTAGVLDDPIMTMPDGTEFDILDGPFCIDSMKWWRLLLDDGTEGWAAEGHGADYFLEPL
jgi:hypothetical protein